MAEGIFNDWEFLLDDFSLRVRQVIIENLEFLAKQIKDDLTWRFSTIDNEATFCAVIGDDDILTEYLGLAITPAHASEEVIRSIEHVHHPADFAKRLNGARAWKVAFADAEASIIQTMRDLGMSIPE